MVVIAAGLAAMPRDVLEAARTDGASEWQVFRRVTVPLLAPVLIVVLITMIINVLKVFDIVIALAPESTQQNANVIALAMWRTAFGGVNDFGTGSAIAVFLFVLVIPVLMLNIRRFRTENVTSVAAPAATVEAPKVQESVAAKIMRWLAKAPVQILLIVIGLLWLVPTIGLFATSILPAQQLASKGWWQIFSKPSLATWSNYHALIHNHGMVNAFKTTAYIALGNTLLVVVFGAMAGYAFAWLEFPGRDWIFIGVIGLLVVPLQMALIPMFRLYDTFSLYGTVWGIVLFHTAFGLPFAIFLLRNFFIGIPKDILESARIDGATEFLIFVRLILPLGLPAIASLAIFQFLWTWNDLIVSLTFGVQPITVWIFGQLREFGTSIDVIAPAAFISLLVPLAVFFAFQRYFVQGLLAGSVK